MNKKVIVTGAIGFIGSNLLAELERRGYKDIVAVDWWGKEEKWKNVAKRSKVYFLAPEELDQYIARNAENIDSIIHLGAISSTTATDGDEVMRHNYRLSTFLYDQCIARGIRFIYASSAATYGNGSEGFDDSESIEYLAQLRPLNLYGWSKNQTDLYITRTHGFKNALANVVGLKFFNVYGPNEYHKGGQMSVIGPFLKQLQEKGEIALFKSNTPGISDGEQQRDFVYVADCVDVIIWMMEHKDVGGLFNVGTGVSTTYNDIARHIIEASGLPGEIRYVEMPANLKDQYQNYTCADIRRLREAGYDKEMTSPRDGIRDYIQNFLTKQDKYI